MPCIADAHRVDQLSHRHDSAATRAGLVHSNPDASSQSRCPRSISVRAESVTRQICARHSRAVEYVSCRHRRFDTGRTGMGSFASAAPSRRATGMAAGRSARRHDGGGGRGLGQCRRPRNRRSAATFTSRAHRIDRSRPGRRDRRTIQARQDHLRARHLPVPLSASIPRPAKVAATLLRARRMSPRSSRRRRTGEVAWCAWQRLRTRARASIPVGRTATRRRWPGWESGHALL